MSLIQTPVLMDRAPQPAASGLIGFRAYLVATSCVALALVLRSALDSLWGDTLPYATFFLSVLVVVQFADTGPVLLTVFAGFLLGDWFFVPPRHSLLIAGPADQINAVLFFFLTGMVLLLSQRTRKAMIGERAAHTTLLRQVEALRESEARYSSVVENSHDAILLTDHAGAILAANQEACRLFKRTERELCRIGRNALVDPTEAQRVAAAVTQREQTGHFQIELTFVRSDGTRFLGEVSSGVFKDRDGLPRNSTIIRDITDRRRGEQERERLVRELQAALNEVKTLSGLLPICAHCKKIRDDQGYWNQIELYIRHHSDARFTHSICPECSTKFYPELFSQDWSI